MSSVKQANHRGSVESRLHDLERARPGDQLIRDAPYTECRAARHVYTYRVSHSYFCIESSHFVCTRERAVQGDYAGATRTEPPS